LRAADVQLENLKPTAAEVSNMEILSDGGAVISFDDVSAISRPMKWSMTFDSKGKLLKATHSPAPPFKVIGVPQSAGAVKSTPVPPTVVDVTGKLVQ